MIDRPIRQTAAPAAAPSAKPAVAAPPPPAPPTGPTPAARKAEQEKWAKDAETAKKKADADLTQAHSKAAKANANLAKDGSGVRVEPEVREGDVRYKFGNFVPTRILTEDEQKALEDMKPEVG